MTAYFEAKPVLGPRKFYTKRKAPVTCIVIHTTESLPDLKGADAGAENVAEYLRTTQRQASYHAIADSDSGVHVCPWQWVAFHCRTMNSRSIGISLATQAHRWPTLPAIWVNKALANAADLAAEAIDWVDLTYDVQIPYRHITADEAKRGVPGFVSHGQMDPGRRSDPGPNFPWSQFLKLVEHADERYAMKRRPVEAWQHALDNAGFHLAVDDDFGPTTQRLSMKLLAQYEVGQQRIAELQAELEQAGVTVSTQVGDPSRDEQARKWNELRVTVRTLRTMLDDISA